MAGEFGGVVSPPRPGVALLSVGADTRGVKFGQSLRVRDRVRARGTGDAEQSADAPATTAAEKERHVVDDGGRRRIEMGRRLRDSRRRRHPGADVAAFGRGDGRAGRIASPRLNSSKHIAAASVPMNTSPAPVDMAMSPSRGRLHGWSLRHLQRAARISHAHRLRLSRRSCASSLIVEDVSFASASTRAMTSSMERRLRGASPPAGVFVGRPQRPRLARPTSSSRFSRPRRLQRIIASPKQTLDLADGYVFDVTTVRQAQFV